jgi:uroporphyrinogen decarboxylase
VFGKGQNEQEIIFEDKNTDVVGIDFTQNRQKMKKLAQQYKKVLQGNMDPGCLLGGGARIKEEVTKILEDWIDIPFVFNLGHGMWPCHDPQAVEFLVTEVHEQSKAML